MRQKTAAREFRRMRTFWIMVTCFIAGAALVAGCGPSMEEIRAREAARVEREARQRQQVEEARRQAEEARRQAEEAKRQAEKARQERITAAMAAGEDAARKGLSEVALSRYRQALAEVERYGEQDVTVRKAIISSLGSMVPPPTIPDDALRFMARGEAKVKMGGTAGFKGAAEEMEQAVTAAPWVADAYFNLGIVQEKAEMYREAIRNLQLYLFAAPRSPNANAIQARIYAMEVLAEEKEKVLGLAGSWRSAGGNTYKVTVDGNRIRIEGAAVYKTSGGEKMKHYFTHDLEKKGSVLEGSLTIARDGVNGCYFPNETVPESGFLRADGKYLKVEWKETLYSWTSQGTVCTGVTSMGKSGTSLELVERIAAQ